MQSIIKIKSLNVTYFAGRANEVKALRDVGLEIHSGEFIIFFGPSGCGKSTLLYAIAGLETDITGSIHIGGKNIAEFNYKELEEFHQKKTGMIFQAYYLINSLSVLQNVVLPQIAIGGKRKEREKKSLELLEHFGVKAQADKLPNELSGGQQQRVAICRSLINNPEILLADEPVGNLDSRSAESVMKLLKDLNKEHKKTIILVTHNPAYLEAGDRIFYMKDGLITKETVNREKHKVKKGIGDSPVTEIEKIMRNYHGLSPAQINMIIMPYKAKLFAYRFVANRNMEEIKVLENIIQRKLAGAISRKEFFDTLHRPYQEGGVGFDKRTAEKIIKSVNRRIKAAYYSHGKDYRRETDLNEPEKITPEEKARYAASYLLKTCYAEYYRDLDKEITNRLEKAVKKRLLNNSSKVEFFQFLDQPFKEGGVGLNSKTARAIAEELELILALGCGLLPKIQSEGKINQTKL